MSNNDIKLSRLLSLILRHKPETIGIKLDEHGWADVKEMITGIRAYGRQVDMATLERIVAGDDKQRYSFNDERTKIRANQGHSVKVDVELKECEPPDILYHGTASRFLDSIRAKGILKQKRHHVHLSADKQTAFAVGKRHGTSAVLLIDAKKLAERGHRFYLSANGVWLCDDIPWEGVEGVEYAK